MLNVFSLRNNKGISYAGKYIRDRFHGPSFDPILHAQRFLLTKQFGVKPRCGLPTKSLTLLLPVKMSSSTSTKRENRLAQSKSPYLREHRHNPVDWYQWGEEAFQAAQSRNKPIFLSVGYSACHWCHVMRRESFDDDAIAKIMNANFVNIKVDREERPDVDRVYMTYCQATTGSGGWPLSVWLTPELKPFLAGTYFPPDDRYPGHPGFRAVLKSVIDTWTKRPDDVRRISDRMIATLQEHMDPSKNKEKIRQSETERSLTLHSSDTIDRVVTHFESSFDGEHGGFSHGGPKFPTPPNLNFMFRVYAERLNKNSEKALGSRDMTLATLLHMYRGGIHDRLGGGFHRYSVDKFWHVPHFEKMMYDQGQLAVCYAEATQIINEMRMRGENVDATEQWWRVALRGIMNYVIRDMSHPEGGFYSAEDAEAVPAVDGGSKPTTNAENHEEKREGAFYVWTEKQIRDVLGAEKLPSSKRNDLSLADAILHHFTCKEKGNVSPQSDPHNELTNQNVFMQRSSLADTAEFFSISLEDMRDALEKACQLLAEARAKRPRPALDDKMITGWNALMISGCAKAYQATGKVQYLERGLQAVRFLETHAYNKNQTGTLLRCVYVDANDPQRIHEHDAASNQLAVEGSCDDYAFLIRALIDMYESSSDPSLLEWALVLQRKQDELFWDAGEDAAAGSSSHAGGYFSSRRGQSDIVLDIKDDQDNAEPSANSVSAQNLIRLHCYFDQPDLLQRVDRIFDVFRTRILRGGYALTEMLIALMARTNPEKLQIVLCTDDANSRETDDMLKCIFKFYLPFKILMVLDERNRRVLEAVRPELKEMKTVDGKATVYVCANFTCQEPCTDPEALDALLRKRIGKSEGESDAEGGFGTAE